MHAISLFLRTMPDLRPLFLILLLLCTAAEAAAQGRKPKRPPTRPDTVFVPASQKALFIQPKRNLLTTHFDLSLGAARPGRTDHSELGISAAVKGLYALTGALYVNMGIGMTSLRGRPQSEQTPGQSTHAATLATLPIGLGFTIGDDRVQVINGIDFFPVYYVDHPYVKRDRQFAFGAGAELGFHIRIRERLHLGMICKLQLFQPYDRDEHQSFPRYGFVGGGLLLRYD